MSKILFSCVVFLCFLFFTESLEEFSVCTNFDGTSGVCIVDRNCKWALEKLKSKEIKASQFVRCGLKGSSTIICCKDESVPAINTVKPTVKQQTPDFVFDSSENVENPTPVSPPRLTLRKSEEACELIKKIKASHIDFHIINGEGADPGEFPHMTAIGFSDEVEVDKYTYDCGGSLISKRFILTAGHCVNSRARQPKVVKLGKVSLGAALDADQEAAQDVTIKKIHLHPSYTARKKYNDIALLELETGVEYQMNVRPACLYSKKESFPKEQSLIISGWGLTNTSTREKASWLQKAEIFELNLEDCKKIYGNINLQQLPDNLLKSQLCATSTTKEGKILDACQGDSGGPLQYKTFVKQDSLYYIVGITSFGASCGSEVPGVYTRVAEYLDWIESVVWPKTVTIDE